MRTSPYAPAAYNRVTVPKNDLTPKADDKFEEKYPTVNSLLFSLSRAVIVPPARHDRSVPFLCKSTPNAKPRFSYPVETTVAKLRYRLNGFRPGRNLYLQDVKSAGGASGVSQRSVGGR